MRARILSRSSSESSMFRELPGARRRLRRAAKNATGFTELLAVGSRFASAEDFVRVLVRHLVAERVEDRLPGMGEDVLDRDRDGAILRVPLTESVARGVESEERWLQTTPGVLLVVEVVEVSEVLQPGHLNFGRHGFGVVGVVRSDHEIGAARSFLEGRAAVQSPVRQSLPARKPPST